MLDAYSPWEVRDTFKWEQASKVSHFMGWTVGNSEERSVSCILALLVAPMPSTELLGWTFWLLGHCLLGCSWKGASARFVKNGWRKSIWRAREWGKWLLSPTEQLRGLPAAAEKQVELRQRPRGTEPWSIHWPAAVSYGAVLFLQSELPDTAKGVLTQKEGLLTTLVGCGFGRGLGGSVLDPGQLWGQLVCEIFARKVCWMTHMAWLFLSPARGVREVSKRVNKQMQHMNAKVNCDVLAKYRSPRSMDMFNF